MQTPVTHEQLQDAIKVVMIVSEAIKNAKRIPSGHLYAMLQSACPTLDIGAYQKLLEVIKKTGLVVESNHELIWVGAV